MLGRAQAVRIGARNGTGGAVLREIMRLDRNFWARRVWVDFRKPSWYVADPLRLVGVGLRLVCAAIPPVGCAAAGIFRVCNETARPGRKAWVGHAAEPGP